MKVGGTEVEECGQGWGQAGGGSRFSKPEHDDDAATLNHLHG